MAGLINNALAWLEGFTYAIRLMPPQTTSWWSPELVAAGLSAVAALAAASAAFTANRQSELRAISDRRLEILRISAENNAELLTMKDRFAWEMRQARYGLDMSYPSTFEPIVRDIDAALANWDELIEVMITANRTVTEAVLSTDKGKVREWDDFIRQALRKRQEIAHIKGRQEIKVEDIRIRVSAQAKR